MVLTAFLSEWASSLTAIYTMHSRAQNRIHTVLFLSGRKSRESVVFENVHTRLDEFFKHHFTAFYSEFCVFEDKNKKNSTA